MPGSLRRRPDRGTDAWELRVFLGRDSRGNVRHKSHTFRGSQRAAEKELARLAITQDVVPEEPPEEANRSWGRQTTVNDAIEGWKLNGWGDLSPVTSQRYESVWRVHIQGTIGRERVATLTPYDVERYFRDLKDNGAERETVRYVRSVLNRACRLARKWSGNQLPNPIADTELPTWGLENTSDPVRAPTSQEVRDLLLAAKNRTEQHPGHDNAPFATATDGGMHHGKPPQPRPAAAPPPRRADGAFQPRCRTGPFGTRLASVLAKLTPMRSERRLAHWGPI